MFKIFSGHFWPKFIFSIRLHVISISNFFKNFKFRNFGRLFWMDNCDPRWTHGRLRCRSNRKTLFWGKKKVFFGPKFASFWTFLVKNYFPLPKISQKWLRLYLKWFSTIFTSWFFEGKTQKLENTFFENFAIFYLEFPSTQSKTIFEKIFENSLIFETFHGEKILENSKKMR